MGIVIRQSFWSSALIYIGVAFGYVNTLILLPYFMDIEHVGLVRLIQSNGMILLPVVVLGLNGSYIKFYPQFKENITEKHKQFSMQIVSILLASLVFCILIYLFQDQIRSLFEEKSELYNDYIFASLVILVSQALFNYLIAVVWSEYNITIPNFLNEVALRSMVFACILLYGFKVVDFGDFILLVLFSYTSITVILYLVLIIKYEFRFNWKFYTLDINWLKKNFGFGSYTMLITTCSSIVANVSYLLTSSMVGLEANGILIISVFISTIIELPKRVITQIISPFITQNFNDKKLENINKDYQRSSINLGLISLLLGIGIITNLEDLFLTIPKGDVLSTGFTVIVILGFARVFSMISSISAEILTYSEYYRLNIIVTIATAVIIIGLNFLLIPQYGIVGAALSIFISNVFSNGAKMLILFSKYHFSPFVKEHIYLILISFLAFSVAYYLPYKFEPVINILVRSVVTAIVFLTLCLWFKISLEVNNLLNKALGILKRIR
ncbi:MAG: polysaccharide biosynthesis C-terminal domain-containing protein [Bacteroidota bacterium]